MADMKHKPMDDDHQLTSPVLPGDEEGSGGLLSRLRPLTELVNNMIARPPMLYRLIFPEAIWRIQRGRKGSRQVFLTFDDGPVPEVTPQVLDLLDTLEVKATFFMVGDNAQRHPQLVEEVRRRGHNVGNHTMHHLQGLHSTWRTYARDVALAADLLDTTLFRPPHGIMTPAQLRAINARYDVIMYDIVSRDYSRRLSADEVCRNVCRFARNGSIIVFHDSIKAAPRMLEAMPRAVRWLKQQGYEFALL